MSEDKDERARRLAAALRENLKRRKAQARETIAESSRRKPGPMNTDGEDQPDAVFMDPGSSPG